MMEHHPDWKCEWVTEGGWCFILWPINSKHQTVQLWKYTANTNIVFMYGSQMAWEVGDLETRLLLLKSRAEVEKYAIRRQRATGERGE